ncbi:helix-turn-helix domain-containing protein [Larkinella punicea]|uniref:XRE family transcriptional regulator n=1 Tax=Larkinella punicea TaxID=2315727 RepID=A0A368JIG2_9BACT|nr:helix-turn-helix transcriptional regulator [Larkinella punicea]RCR67450.1 XRE family transcriptional regulator [Larkinella punicea]
MDVTKNIKAMREKKGLRQADLAEKLGMERSNYSRLEKRGNDLSIRQIEEIANAMGVSFFELLLPLEHKAFSKGALVINELQNRNIYLMTNQRKLEAFMTLFMEMGEGLISQFGLTKEVFKKQLDPEGKLEEWAKEKVESFKEQL